MDNEPTLQNGLRASLAWKPLPLLSERDNTALVTVVMSVTAKNSVTISF